MVVEFDGFCEGAADSLFRVQNNDPRPFGTHAVFSCFKNGIHIVAIDSNAGKPEGSHLFAEVEGTADFFQVTVQLTFVVVNVDILLRRSTLSPT